MWILAIVLLAAGLTGVVLAVIRSHWQLGLAGFGVIGIGIVYLLAALRRK